MLEIITAESSQRPDGSPPTYDDAMKFVNDAFDNSEDSEVGFVTTYFEISILIYLPSERGARAPSNIFTKFEGRGAIISLL